MATIITRISITIPHYPQRGSCNVVGEQCRWFGWNKRYLISFSHSGSTVTGKEESGGLIGGNYGVLKKARPRKRQGTTT